MDGLLLIFISSLKLYLQSVHVYSASNASSEMRCGSSSTELQRIQIFEVMVLNEYCLISVNRVVQLCIGSWERNLNCCYHVYQSKFIYIDTFCYS
jgi:hypothetical protein